MKLMKNSGNDRVVDALRQALSAGATLDMATPAFSLFAYSELREILEKLHRCRLILPSLEGIHQGIDLQLLGSDMDRPLRNRLQSRWLARKCMEWIQRRADVRGAMNAIPQSMIITGHPAQSNTSAQKVLTGTCSFTTEGFGLTPGNQFGLITCYDSPEEWSAFSSRFSSMWTSLPAGTKAKDRLLGQLEALGSQQSPSLIYYQILQQLLSAAGDALDEDQIVKTATGIRNSAVWKKLFKFQRDGVVGAIDKLERLGGCIIADSVGLGKTFEALAIIKYYELRNCRVLVLCPKRLRDNWTIYKANDRRNLLASDRLNYDVINHTDLSREGGLSGDIDLANINWGNYDLVVIDESHNFRNKASLKGRETRYDRLMKRVIQGGVKTRVLMLSATPVNNRLADLKNQLAFVTEGEDSALEAHGIPSIEATIRQAQLQANRWLHMAETERTPARLLDMLGFDYFKLLDLLTIARSRKHIEKYYGMSETGRFPTRLKPINIKAEVDLNGAFRSIREINSEIRRLTLGAYAPLRYILPHKRAAYDAKYNTQVRGGEGSFKQTDREESLIHLLRVNLLKRMESSVASFALSLQRQLADVNAILERIESHVDTVEELSLDDIEVDDLAFETLLVGRKVKVLLQDVDRVAWRQDLLEDRARLESLLTMANQIDVERDAKLAALREVIQAKCQNPLNPGNRKFIIFTAFADTAAYLYQAISGWAQGALGLHSALVTGGGGNKTTLKGLRLDLSSILTAFSPRSKERSPDLSGEGELDLLIATDCISEGQNLQDCDTLINYDIHWNPVRIIQRFGRIDRIGSPNASIQLINFWPNLELEEYINLEARVTGRMVLLDISATGEENLIEHKAGNQMNDLEYRRRQLEKLQETVIDLEDLSSGISIADLTLTDFRIDLAGFLKESPGRLESLPLGVFSVTTSGTSDSAAIPPGVFFCLRAASEGALSAVEPGYPLAPHYLLHVGHDGTVLLPFTQARQVLERLKKLAAGRSSPDAGAEERFDRATHGGQDMNSVQKLLARAVAAVAGRREERAVASLFSPGGTHSIKGEFQGTQDFEVVAFLVVLPAIGEESRP